jgi:hypothetical protein
MLRPWGYDCDEVLHEENPVFFQNASLKRNAEAKRFMEANREAKRFSGSEMLQLKR